MTDMRLTKDIETLATALIDDLQCRIKGNDELMRGIEKYFPKNKRDLETCYQYKRILEEAINAIKTYGREVNQNG